MHSRERNIARWDFATKCHDDIAKRNSAQLNILVKYEDILMDRDKRDIIVQW